MKFKNKFVILFLMVVVMQTTMAQTISLNNWEYIQIDDDHSKYGDYEEPEWLRYFGVDMMDVNGDNFAEIIAGRELYLNPGGNMEQSWKKIQLPENVDGILFIDIDGDEYGDIIAQALPNVWWFEAKNKEATEWEGKIIGQVPATSHTNSQGFEKGQIISGGREEFVIAGDGNIYMFQIPKKPLKNKWPMKLVAANTSDEGIGLGDIDGDGDIDIAAGRRPAGGKEPLILTWYRNPGSFTDNWENHVLGKSNNPIDRVEVADINGDGKADIVVSEERHPGLEPDGSIFWFEQGEDINSTNWKRHSIATQFSINNMDVKDMDNDGDIDIITSEHKGSELKLQLWSNDGIGGFTENILDKEKESHLGAQTYDMDEDGDLDIVSIGWDQYKFVHLWRNDAISKEDVKWKLFSSAKGDMPAPNSGNQQTASLIADIDNDGVNDFVIAERTAAPAVTWFKKNGDKWDRFVIENESLSVEAGSTYYDIDNDGDTDMVFAGGGKSNEVWWWENPYPKFDKPWVRRTIKKSGEAKHHDQLFGDFDGDGQVELAFWNQRASTLFIAEIPNNPKKADFWERKEVYRYSDDSQMLPRGFEGYPGWKANHEHEGLAKIDMDGDGIEDIIGGGRWFNYNGNGGYNENIIDASYVFTRSAVGQFVEGGRPEVLLLVGDGEAAMFMYEWKEGTWTPKQVTPNLSNGHTLDVIDFNGDGHNDIFSAEMRFGEENPNSKIRILLGDGNGNFKEKFVAKGYGVHEGKIADLDGDGDLDVLGKPYTWQAPLINVWINDGPKQQKK